MCRPVRAGRLATTLDRFSSFRFEPTRQSVGLKGIALEGEVGWRFAESGPVPPSCTLCTGSPLSDLVSGADAQLTRLGRGGCICWVVVLRCPVVSRVRVWVVRRGVWSLCVCRRRW